MRMSATLNVVPYKPGFCAAWEDFIRDSKNGTFLFARNYMEYHQDRFEDCSLLVLSNDDIVAVLPANRRGSEVSSHGGLTYGGLITQATMTTAVFLDVFSEVVKHLRATGCESLVYKTIPFIYHRLPAEEDRYALFLAGATLFRRNVLSVVKASDRIAPQTRRRRGAAKAEKNRVVVGGSDDWSGFWNILTAHLDARFGAAPVHNLAEIVALHRCFSNNIRLFTATIEGVVIAGVVIYETALVAHVQYIATDNRGRESGALDRLFLHLLETTFVDKAYFDFGGSIEHEGRGLNLGLMEQKEGFGGRAVVHDFYRLAL
jgi:hypothetical protein